MIFLQVPRVHSGTEPPKFTETKLQGLSFKLSGTVSRRGPLILTEIRSCNAEVVVIPSDYTDYDGNGIISTLTQGINDKLTNLQMDKYNSASLLCIGT